MSFDAPIATVETAYGAKFEAHELSNGIVLVTNQLHGGLTIIETPSVANLLEVAKKMGVGPKTKAQRIAANPLMLGIFVPNRGKPIMRTKKPGRNELCKCGSGKKYKVCCGRKTANHR